MTARKEHRWPSFLIETLDSAGKHVHTASHRAVNQQMFYTRDAENIRVILTASLSDYGLGGSRGANFAPVLGHGLLTAEGEAWHYYRTCARPLFTRAKQDENLRILEALLQKLWSPSFAEDVWTEEMDLQSMFLDLMLDATLALFFGDSALSDTISRSSDDLEMIDKTAFGASLDVAATYVGNRTVLGNFCWLKQSQEFRRHCKIIRKFIDEWIIRTQYEQRHDKCMTASSIANARYARQDLIRKRNHVQPLLSSGRNTTGALLAVIFYHLMKNPEMYQRLRREIIQTFDFEINENINHASLESCEYLHFCILEGLRLGSILPAIMRSARKDIVLPRGGGSDGQSPIFVEKGSTIIICIYALHYRTDLWGEDVGVFNPERWREYQFDWSFLPFSKGRRQCIGQQLAITQAKYVIARFLQRFDAIRSVDEDCSIQHKTDISTSFVFDSKVKFRFADPQNVDSSANLA
ncbi:hypothetical protein ACLMJK_006085 [Lecanora helva]